MAVFWRPERDNHKIEEPSTQRGKYGSSQTEEPNKNGFLLLFSVEQINKNKIPQQTFKTHSEIKMSNKALFFTEMFCMYEQAWL